MSESNSHHLLCKCGNCDSTTKLCDCQGCAWKRFLSSKPDVPPTISEESKERIMKSFVINHEKYLKERDYQGGICYGSDEKYLPQRSKQGKTKVHSEAYHPEMPYPLVTVAEMSIEKGYKPLGYLTEADRPAILQLLEAAQRHLDKFRLGFDINTEEKSRDGNPTVNQPSHLACAAYNLLMIELQMKQGIAIDDRVFKNGKLKGD